jgi:endonuclease/exonuclease/phosphatase family metal-dependent hydrolase
VAFHPARPALRHLDGRAIECHAGLAVLARAPIHGSMRVHLPCDADGAERIAQLAELGFDGRRLLVANLQLSESPPEARQGQLDAVMAVVQEAHHFDHILVGGDFGAAEQRFGRLAGFVTSGVEAGRDRIVMLDRLVAPCSRLQARPALDARDSATNLMPAERPAHIALLRFGIGGNSRPQIVQAAE